MKVLVTGAEGQLAKSLIEAAAGSGVRLAAFGRPQIDVTIEESIAQRVREIGPDVVINAAAYTAVDKAESDVEAAFAVNAMGAGNVARVAARAGLPVIHISTDYVFDGRKDGVYLETDATGPLNVYGRSKLAGELVVAASNTRHLIVRTSWVHSPFGNNFVKTMLRLAETRHRISVVDDQHGSPSYSLHLADAILDMGRQVLERGEPEDRWGLYHMCGAGETTWCGLAREVFAVWGAHGGRCASVDPIPTSSYPTPARRPANSRFSCGRLQRAFGLELPEWTAGVAACVGRLAAGT